MIFISNYRVYLLTNTCSGTCFCVAVVLALSTCSTSVSLDRTLEISCTTLYPLCFLAAVQVFAKVVPVLLSPRRVSRPSLQYPHKYQVWDHAVYNSTFGPNVCCFRLVSVAPVQLADHGGCHLHGALSGYTH